METYKFQDIRAEKANAVFRYRRIERITTMLRLVEALVLLIALAKFSTQFAFPFKASGEYLSGISVATVLSPKFVFVIGNAIVIVLFLISGHFSSASAAFYDEYAKKCRNYNPQIKINQEDHKSASDAYRYKVPCGNKKLIFRSRSENLDRRSLNGGNDARPCDLRRTSSEMCQRGATDCARKAANEMSSDEFRRTVEAFIERQQRFLREEEEFSAVVSFRT